MLNEAESGIFIETQSKEAIINAIKRYANLNKEDRLFIGSKGKEWIINNYTNDVVCEKYLDELKKLIGD